MLIDRNDLPKHLFGIPDLEVSEDLCAETLAGPWFRLGACSTGSGREKQGVENMVYRQTLRFRVCKVHRTTSQGFCWSRMRHAMATNSALSRARVPSGSARVPSKPTRVS